MLYATTAIALPAQTLTTLFSFDGIDGRGPQTPLVQGTDGNFYGTTNVGGANGYGTVFKITPSGALTTLYSFAGYPADGNWPTGLVQAANGDFYGTTEYGGASCGDIGGCGTVFKITPSGTLTTLYSFCSQGGVCQDGSQPFAGLVQATNGDFYGTTGAGGANCITSVGCGTVFKITPSGRLTTLYNFCSQGSHSTCLDGFQPYTGLVQATNGDFYGTTFQGGASDVCNSGCGTVFKITPGGTLTTLYSFCSQSGCTDGGGPKAGLVQAANEDFYGTTLEGGANDDLCAPISGCGTVFKITPSGALTTLYSFCSQSGCTDGRGPQAELVEGTDGNLYGTTVSGGSHDEGTVFKITPSGTIRTLYNFCPPSACPHGENPFAGLIQGTNGDFYGTTSGGGAIGDGTVFSLSVGLGPFVKTLPHNGEVGAAITILGTDLTGTTSVSFNGTPAAFEVVSATEITTTVPAGATTGSIQVTTPGGALVSSGPFLVLP